MNVLSYFTRALVLVAAFTETSGDLPVDQLLTNGKAAWKSLRFQEAFDHFDKAVRLAPDNPDAYYGRAQATLGLKRFDNAAEDFTTAIKLRPTILGAHRNRAMIRFYKGDIDGTLSDYAEAIAIDPNDHVAFKNRSLVFIVLGKADKALADANEAVRLRPDDVQAYARRSHAYFLKGQLDLSAADANEAIRRDSKCPWGFERRAFIRLREGNVLAAIEDATKALEREGGDSEMYAVRASGYARLRRHEEASDDWRRFTTAQRFDFDLLVRNWARRSLDESDLSGASILSSAILERKPYDFEAFSIRGRARLAADQIDDAIADLSRAIRIGNDGTGEALATAHEARGKAYEASERLAEARLDFDEAERLRAEVKPSAGNMSESSAKSFQ